MVGEEYWNGLPPRLRPKPPLNNVSKKVLNCKESQDVKTVKKYLRVIRNSQNVINEDSQEFYKPEFLEYEKRILQTDINNIKRDIEPLSEKYSELLTKICSNTTDDNDPNRKYVEGMIMEISDKQRELKEYELELFKARRTYCDSVKVRLELEVKEHLEIIGELSSITNDIVSKIDAYKKEIDQLYSSPETVNIRDQDARIGVLVQKLKSLKRIEKGLEEQAIASLTSSAPESNDYKKIRTIRKSIGDVQRAKLVKVVERRKRIQDLDRQICVLKEELHKKKNKSDNKSRRDSWRKNVNLSDGMINELNSINSMYPRKRLSGNRNSVFAVTVGPKLGRLSGLPLLGTSDGKKVLHSARRKR